MNELNTPIDHLYEQAKKILAANPGIGKKRLGQMLGIKTPSSRLRIFRYRGETQGHGTEPDYIRVRQLKEANLDWSAARIATRIGPDDGSRPPAPSALAGSSELSRPQCRCPPGACSRARGSCPRGRIAGLRPRRQPGSELPGFAHPHGGGTAGRTPKPTPRCGKLSGRRSTNGKSE